MANKELYLTNSMVALVVSLKEEDGTLIFKERLEKRIDGYSNSRLNTFSNTIIKRLRENEVTSTKVIINGIKHENVSYIIKALSKKNFGILSIKTKTVYKATKEAIIKSDITVEWNEIKEKLEKMEEDGNVTTEVAGSLSCGIMHSSNIRRLEKEGYLVRTVTMKGRVKYIVIKDKE